jgi:hypothetical protein
MIILSYFIIYRYKHTKDTIIKLQIKFHLKNNHKNHIENLVMNLQDM